MAQSVNTEVLRADDVDLHTVEICIEMIEKLNPDKAADLVPIFQDKRRRVEKSLREFGSS
jgi:hypothetical protein